MKAIGTIACYLIFCFSSLSQSIKVVDSAGQSVSYATIEVPKKKVAVFADSNGTINLSSLQVADADTLVISAIGFITTMIPAVKAGRSIVLTRQIKELEDVFVYNGEWKKENRGSLKTPKKILTP